MTATDLQARSDVAIDDTWDLSAIYATEEAWEADIAAVRADLPALSAFQGTIGDGAEQLLNAVQIEESIGERLSRIFSYVGLRKDEDNTNTDALAAYDRAIALSVEAGQAASFLEPEVLALPDGTIERYLSEEPRLAHYRHALEDLLRQRDHVLSAEMERMLASASEVMMAPGQIFTMLNNADMDHGTIVDEDGNETALTKGNFLRYLESRSRPVRQAAFEGMHKPYVDHRNTLAASYSASVKTDIFVARTRGYESALQSSLQPSNIPVSVYDNLVSVINERLPLLHRYIALRKRVLGLDELATHDLYVPIVPQADANFSYEQGVDAVMRSLTPLGEDYLHVLRGAFDSRWVDVYENKGKTSGAYSWGVYGVHPFILMNWGGRLDDVFTLGHEVGHAMHSHYTSSRQPFTYGRYTLFVAEVASTVNELLMNETLRNETTDPAFEMYLINHALEGFRGTVYRQTMFAEFERWSHEFVEGGGALTPESLSEAYGELCQRYYGPDINIGEFTPIEWARIPHFYRAFYVYQYATGMSAAAALSRMILDGDDTVRRRYIDFLSGGSSKYSLDLLRDAGVDMTTEEPIQQALDVFESLLNKLEALIDASPVAAE